MNRPLILASLGALAGFGFWIWLTGPGTSVPNALIAFVIGIGTGRLAWMLVERRDDSEDPVSPDGTPEAPPLPPGRSPPPPDTASWRRPGDGTS